MSVVVVVVRNGWVPLRWLGWRNGWGRALWISLFCARLGVRADGFVLWVGEGLASFCGRVYLVALRRLGQTDRRVWVGSLIEGREGRRVACVMCAGMMLALLTIASRGVV